MKYLENKGIAQSEKEGLSILFKWWRN